MAASAFEPVAAEAIMTGRLAGKIAVISGGVVCIATMKIASHLKSGPCSSGVHDAVRFERGHRQFLGDLPMPDTTIGRAQRPTGTRLEGAQGYRTSILHGAAHRGK